MEQAGDGSLHLFRRTLEYYIVPFQGKLLMTGSPLEEANAQLVSIIIVTAIILSAQGMKGKLIYIYPEKVPGRTCIHLAPGALVSGVMQIVTNKQLLLLCSFALMIIGADAHDHNEGFQCCICADPNVWEIRDYAKVAALVLAGALLPGLLIFGGAGFARRMRFNVRPPVPAPVPALPIYPAVQGNNIDDVLANAPRVTRLNTPLRWL